MSEIIFDIFPIILQLDLLKRFCSFKIYPLSITCTYYLKRTTYFMTSFQFFVILAFRTYIIRLIFRQTFIYNLIKLFMIPLLPYIQKVHIPFLTQ